MRDHHLAIVTNAKLNTQVILVQKDSDCVSTNQFTTVVTINQPNKLWQPHIPTHQLKTSMDEEMVRRSGR